MAAWKKEILQRENGGLVEMLVPEIVSASRSTDIPAFYADWFFHRLQVGYSAWTNPFNGVKGYVSYKNTRFIVFWSKDPSPLLNHLDELKEKKIGCYIQYSLNDYVKEGLEKGVRPLEYRIDTFKRLVDKLGLGSVIWRFDPLLLTNCIDINALLGKIENIGNQLKGYTEKLVFSYADIAIYKKVRSNLEKNSINCRDWTEDEMCELAKGLYHLNKSWGYTLATCGEKIDLKPYGIEHNHCIDDALIIRLAYHDKKLMDFLKVKMNPIPSPSIFGDTEPLPSDAIILPNNTYATYGDNRDKGQREFCGCMKSKDIGEYNTCIHLCEYCYANTSKQTAVKNYNLHKENPFGETITGI
jgi:hypothetical protein